MWCHYILDTSVNKIDYVKQYDIKCSKIEMEMSPILRRLRPKGLPSSGFRDFYLDGIHQEIE